jgi:hypothetical protein
MTAVRQCEVTVVSVVSYTQRERSVRKNITDSFRTGTAANHRNLTNPKKPPTVVRFLPGRHPR